MKELLPGLLMLLSVLTSLRAQSPSADSLAAAYPFLKIGENCLHFPGGDSLWGRLFQKLHEVRQDSSAQLRVLHIGGSHVQGGVFHERIRLGLEALLPSERGASPGFFFPYALSGTNMPSFMTVNATGTWEGRRAVKAPGEGIYGISALQAITETPFASVIVSLRHPEGRSFRARTLRIYYDMEASNLVPEPFSFDCPDHIRYDSLAGFVEWQFAEAQDALDLVLLPDVPDREDYRFVLWGMEYLDPAPALVVDMVGANGASLKTYLGTARLGDQVAALAPDLVIFGIGVNDANGPNGRFDPKAFETRYSALMQVFREANPEVVFLFITNNDTWYRKRQVNRNVFAVVESMYLLAGRVQGAVWDQFELMGGLNSIVDWQRAGLAKSDRIHFTSAGYTLLGQLLGEAFRSASEHYTYSERTD